MIYEKLPVVLMSVLSTEKQGSTNSAIATYLLEHLDEARTLGVQELAIRCRVGTASLSRFCKDIGLADFAELKSLINVDMVYFERQSQSPNVEDRLQTYMDTTLDAISLAGSKVDIEGIHALCRDIYRYPKVATFGLLKAEGASANLQVNLLMQGKFVYTNMAYQQQLQYIMNADKDTLIIIFSCTGAYFDYPQFRIPSSRLPKGRLWMVSGGEEVKSPFIYRSVNFPFRGGRVGHPYHLLYLSTVISQEYAALCEENEQKQI